MKYQNILQSCLYHRIKDVILKMESVSSESQFNENKHCICRINLVFIHQTDNISWSCRDNNNNINNINSDNDIKTLWP